jgi:hypothetical protein
MVEHGYRQFMPGDEFTVRLDLQRVRAHLRAAGVVFRHEGRRDSLAAEGTPVDPPDHGGGRTAFKRAVLQVSVEGGATPGIYRVDRAWVETISGRTYEYEGETLEGLREFAFEVLEEPDERPELGLSYG